MLVDAHIERDVTSFLAMTRDQRQAALRRMRKYEEIYFLDAVMQISEMPGPLHDAGVQMQAAAQERWRYWHLVYERCLLALAEPLPQVIIG